MILPSVLDRAVHIVDSSGVCDVLHGALRTSNRGRKSDPRKLRALLIGMFLAIHCEGAADLTSIARVLSTEISLTDQYRVGLRDPDTTKMIISYDDLRYLSKVFMRKLGYGTGVTDISEEERANRHQVILEMIDRVLDVFDFGWTSQTYAVDATGIWSWIVGRSSDDPGDDDTEWDEDGEEDEGDDLEDGEPGDTAPFDPAVGDAPARARTLLRDGDARWAGKTSKTGKTQRFFGYHEHTLLQAPGGNEHPHREPRLIRRLEITPANEDVVAVTLRLLDRLPRAARDVIVDRHYHYKSFDRWLSELTRRKIRQHHDLRKDEQGFTEFQRIRWAAGWGHCPSTPDPLGRIDRPGPKADKRDIRAARARVIEREHYAMRVVARPDEKGTIRLECPALRGTVGCPLRAGTVDYARLVGRPIIEHPPDDTVEPLPACCTQQTVAVTPPDRIRKLMQRHYWGSPQWEREFNKRTYVEGSYGGRKNPNTEDLSRGITRGYGVAWMNLILLMTAASYNLRTLRNWQERTKRGDASHPLLQPDAVPLGFEFMWADRTPEPAGRPRV